MEFGLSDDQRMIKDSLRGFLESQMPLDEVRVVAKRRDGFDAELWQGLTELGVPGLLVPENFGGAGLSMLDAAVVAESLGYAAAPAPFAGACVMAPLAIRLGGSEAQQKEWLPAIAAGRMRVGVGVDVLSDTTSQSDLTLDSGKLHGRISGVLDSAHATHFLIFLADGQAVLVAADAQGVSVEARPTVDRTRPLADITFNGAAVTKLCEGDKLANAKQVLDAGRLMLAADTLGAGQRMIEKAVDYAAERVQFDRVIASFQAIKHMCAEMSTSLEPCRSLVWYAAHAQDHIQDERRLMANLAKSLLNDIGRDVARTATEVHGGMGFTDLMGLHFWFKRITFNRQVLGGSETCRAEVADIQGWVAA